MTQKLEKIRSYCIECGGEGEVSNCCKAQVDNKRCVDCGRFCRIDVCYNCEGYGYQEFCVGDEVDVFVCVWSEEYLKEALYKPKKVGDTKTFTGEIVEIVDNWNTFVKIDKKKIKVKIEDLETR